MFLKRKGFTLIELLIAAAIIGALAVFATLTFRQSASDIRIQDAKSRAKVIAMAARRMKIENQGVVFYTEGTLEDPSDPRSTAEEVANTCTFPRVDKVDLQKMVDCGYLEYRKYVDPNFLFRFDNKGQVCVKVNPGGKVSGKASDEFCTNGENGVGTGVFQ